jgi:glutamyl-tRNA reductase
MGIQLISVSYQHTPIEIRERFSYSRQEQEVFLSNFIKNDKIKECVLIATCNRTELYCYGNEAYDHGDIFLSMQQALVQMAGFKDDQNISTYLRFYQDQKASHHLFQVAAGLDSMVIGEDQILGQVKTAYEMAHKLHTTGTYLNTLFRYAVTGAKKVKTDTNLSKMPISTATIAIKAVMQEFHGNLNKKNILLIGASGEIGSIVLKNLRDINGITLYATTRQKNLQHYGMQIQEIPYEKRYEMLDQMDVIISATSSPHYTITKQEFVNATITRKKRVCVDLAVPMDLEPSIKDLDQIAYYNIDDFETISKSNNEQKQKEAETAGEILYEYEAQFEKWRIFKKYGAVIDTLTEFMQRETKKKDVMHAIHKLFYQVRDTIEPEELEIFFRCIDERNRRWEE